MLFPTAMPGRPAHRGAAEGVEICPVSLISPSIFAIVKKSDPSRPPSAANFQWNRVMKMRKKYRPDSILNSFLILLIAIVIVPVIAVFWITYSGLVERLYGTYNTLAKVSSDTATSAIGEALSSVNDVSLAIIGNDRLCDFLTKSPQSPDYLRSYSSAAADVESYCQNNRYILGIRIDAMDSGNSVLSNGINSTYEITAAEKERMKAFQEPWFWTSETSGKVGICRLIRNKNDDFNPIGYLKIILNENVLRGQFETNLSSKDDRYALIDTRDDRIVLASNDATREYVESLFQTNYPQIKYLRRLTVQQNGSYINVRRLGTKAISVVTISSDQADYLNSLKYRNIVTVCMLFLIAAFVYSILYRRVIVTPLDALRVSMRTSQKDKPAPPPVTVYAWGEIQDLVDSFNEMSRKLNYLYETNYKNELKLRDAHLLILQSEINPHFLYNVLDSIHWMIELDDKPAAGAMVQLLAKSFRMSLQLSDNSVISLDKELEHLKLYIGIEQYRFRDKINIQLNVQEGVGRSQVVKFILQPLVENAIVHGIHKSATGRGNIIVSIYRREQSLIYDVRDDGIGADTTRVQAILNGTLVKEHTLECYALENIQSRLSLYYGPSAGIHFQPRDGGGSVFTVTQPYIQTKEGKQADAATDDC